MIPFGKTKFPCSFNWRRTTMTKSKKKKHKNKKLVYQKKKIIILFSCSVQSVIKKERNTGNLINRQQDRRIQS